MTSSVGRVSPTVYPDHSQPSEEEINLAKEILDSSSLGLSKDERNTLNLFTMGFLLTRHYVEKSLTIINKYSPSQETSPDS